MQELSSQAPDVGASPTESVLASASVSRTLTWLVIAPVVIGLIAALMSYPVRDNPTLLGLVFFGIVLSQTSLLGIWGGLGTNPWWTRLIGSVLGVSYLAPLLEFGVFEPGHVLPFHTVIATAF